MSFMIIPPSEFEHALGADPECYGIPLVPIRMLPRFDPRLNYPFYASLSKQVRQQGSVAAGDEEWEKLNLSSQDLEQEQSYSVTSIRAPIISSATLPSLPTRRVWLVVI